ncbi:glycosyltransferase family 39 protein [Naasia lichenicola]|uniref:Glycosyltransferase RgtA/B/C/D-like domain-containing protein n=1 Tax=Naasia lichenicola TaxID=2565933 RepID=A0A4S4FEE4_9MICO|nr:hypothetical protein [Naasia lichenicola]THG28510.1 hypothetical protein E6C64_16960 [Naasia lichenicola]
MTGASTRTMAAVAGLVATIVSVSGSWIPSFWGDEAASIMSARRPLSTLPELLHTVDAVHGSYYVLLHFWIDLFGFSPVMARLPSSIAIGIVAAGAVVLAQQLAGRRAALFTAAVVVLLPRLTLVGTETRSFALSAALVIWASVLLVAILGSASRPSARPIRHGLLWLLYAALMTGASYLFLFAVLVLPAHAVVVALQWRRARAKSTRGTRDRWIAPLSFLAAAVGTLIALDPLIRLAIEQRNQLDYLYERDAANPYAVLVTTWFGNPVYAALAIAAMLLPLVAVLVHRAGGRPWLESARDDRGGPGIAAAVAIALTPMALLLLLNIAVPVFTHRYLVGSAPAVAVLIGATLARLRPRVAIAGVLLLTLAALPSYVQQRTPFAKVGSDWAQSAAIIHANASPGDALVFDELTPVSARPRLAQRVYPAEFTGLRNILLDVPYDENDYWWDRTYKVPTVAGRFADVDTVWAVQYRAPGSPPDQYQMAELADLGFAVEQQWDCHSSVVYKLTRQL